MDSRKQRPYVPPLPLLPRKKHKCMRFTPNRSTGFVEKLSTFEIRVVAVGDGNPKLRALGAEVRGQIVESPPFVLAEVDDADNYLCRLEQMEADLKKVKADLEEKRVTNALIVDKGFSICVRAFSDYVVNRFCELAGKGHLDPYAQRTWLFSYDATKFVKKGGSFSFFQTSITVNTALLNIVRRLRNLSVKYNKDTCHKFKPVQVAFALHRLADFKASDLVFQMFKNCFGITSETVMESHKKGTLEPMFFTEYTM